MRGRTSILMAALVISGITDCHANPSVVIVSPANAYSNYQYMIESLTVVDYPPPQPSDFYRHYGPWTSMSVTRNQDETIGIFYSASATID